MESREERVNFLCFAAAVKSKLLARWWLSLLLDLPKSHLLLGFL